MTTLPIDFEQRMKASLCAEYDGFLAALAEKPPVSIRQNPLKKAEILLPDASPIPWVANGFYLPQRPVFTLDPAFHAGAYYVQEASSMLIDFALRQKIDFDKPLKILDLCAAPGGKSTLLASMMSDKSLLLSNEVIKSRVTILKENIHKWGNPNVMISNHEVEEMSALEAFFDIIVIDAPCSGEGLFRKDENAKKEWSLDNVNLCSTRQRKIVANAIKLLREGGILLYSTCTYNADENIDNVKWITEKFDCASENIALPSEWGVETIEQDNTFGYQCFPHKVKGEGFFFSVFTKQKHTFSKENTVFLTKNAGVEPLDKKDIERIEPWLKDAASLNFYRKGNGTIVAIPKAIARNCAEIERGLRRVSFGIEMGEFKGKDFIPAHNLALSNLISPDLQAIELDRDEALLFLKKELHSVESDLKGWTLARYEGLNLGWVKVLPNRINNYLPTEFRIRMDLPN